MSDFAALMLLVLVAFALVGLAWWLLIASEGVYLGRGVVVWLYDLFAPRYDAIKHFDPTYDHMFLAQPLMERAAPNRAPYVLDVATGTGRLPVAMLRHAHFEGPLVGLDASRPMLDRAADKLSGQAGVMLLQGDAEHLPFGQGSFDIVTCLEALEFVERPSAVIREMERVLSPGGILLITHRRTARLMPGKVPPIEKLQAELMHLGMTDIHVEAWQVDYDRVWARKGRGRL